MWDLLVPTFRFHMLDRLIFTYLLDIFILVVNMGVDIVGNVLEKAAQQPEMARFLMDMIDIQNAISTKLESGRLIFIDDPFHSWTVSLTLLGTAIGGLADSWTRSNNGDRLISSAVLMMSGAVGFWAGGDGVNGSAESFNAIRNTLMGVGAGSLINNLWREDKHYQNNWVGAFSGLIAGLGFDYGFSKGQVNISPTDVAPNIGGFVDMAKSAFSFMSGK